MPAAAAALLAAAGAARAVEPVAMYPIDSPQPLDGTCFHAGDIYAVTKGNLLLRFDPVTGARLELVDPMVPGLDVPHIHGIAEAGETFWTFDAASGAFYELRFSDYEVVDSFDHEEVPGHPPYGMSFDGGLLWAGHHSSGESTPVHAFDTAAGEIVSTMEFGAVDVHGLAWAGGRLWVLDNFSDELLRVGADGAVEETFALPENYWGSLCWDGAAFWLTDLDDFYTLDLPVPDPADLDGDGTVGTTDMLLLLGAWGACAECIQCPADLDGDCQVGVTDFLELLAAWG